MLGKGRCFVLNGTRSQLACFTCSQSKYFDCVTVICLVVTCILRPLPIFKMYLLPIVLYPSPEIYLLDGTMSTSMIVVTGSHKLCFFCF